MFDLFSQFTGLVLIAHHEHIIQQHDSTESLFAKTVESNDYLAEIFPYSGNMQTYRTRRTDQLTRMAKLDPNTDFKVPLKVFVQNCKLLFKNKPLV